LSKFSNETTRILPGMCRRMGLEKKSVCEKTKHLLKSRHDMGWTATDYYTADENIVYYYRPEELEKALEWIQTYYYRTDDEKDEEHLMVLWESGLMRKIFLETMEKLSSFHRVGWLYHKLITKRYLDERVLTESELETLLDVSRSTLYARLNEAVTAFGLAFCGIARTYSLEDIEQDDMKNGEQHFESMPHGDVVDITGNILEVYSMIS